MNVRKTSRGLSRVGTVGTLAVLLTAILNGHAMPQKQVAPEALRPVPFHEVEISAPFWTTRIQTNSRVTLETCLDRCEATGRIRNFAIAGGLVKGEHEGLRFNDSDLYKVIEGAAYTLSLSPDADLEERIDAIIEQIAAAQQKDGYLNTYFTLVKPQERWRNIRDSHELYCAGHLFEAAVAYYQATGKRKLLDVAIRFAEHIESEFGPGRRLDPCGHQEIELALVKLARATGESRYAKLAEFFLNQRGHAKGRTLFGEYCQDHKPVREQFEAVGHAVRAMYQYCAMADIAGISGDGELLKALDRLWHDVVDRKMYITGGVGPSGHNEGFTMPYDLPNDAAYCETCAAIGMALWNHRMFLLTGEGKYVDLLEREIYNGLVSGVSLSGDLFFYVNPLGSRGDHHRQPWFDCSCCPTNIVRYVPAMGERVYAYRDNVLFVCLYMGSSAEIPLGGGKVRLTQETDYPWSGKVGIRVEPQASFEFELRLRQPGWCKAAAKLSLNGKELSARQVDGFMSVGRTWEKGDIVSLEIPMEPERVYADRRVEADVGRVALQRGPLVYCLEGADHGGHVRNIVLPPDAPLTAAFERDLLGGVVVIGGKAIAVNEVEGKRVTTPVSLKAVPYHLWDNRQPGEMVVWIPESVEIAALPGEISVVGKDDVRIRASHCYRGDSLAAVGDDLLPMSSGDQGIPRMTWWDHRGTLEWILYEFPSPRKVASSSVYWFDDTGVGYCRVPQSWRALWHDGEKWVPVKLTGGSTYATARDCFNSVEFEPVTTAQLRLEVQLKPGFSAGILEWRVTEPKE